MTTAPVHMIPAGVTYLTFSKDHDQEKARLRFLKRYGVEPAEVVRDHNLLWLGPIPETPNKVDVIDNIRKNNQQR